MADIFQCGSCGFLCVEGNLSKTQGACPKCGMRTSFYAQKFSIEGREQTEFHRQIFTKV